MKLLIKLYVNEIINKNDNPSDKTNIAYKKTIHLIIDVLIGMQLVNKWKIIIQDNSTSNFKLKHKEKHKLGRFINFETLSQIYHN